MSTFSTFLFAQPSFLEGMGRVLDFGGTLNEYNRARTPEEADAIAAWADWSAVGADLLGAAGAPKKLTAASGATRVGQK